jgi:hypothetical protein
MAKPGPQSTLLMQSHDHVDAYDFVALGNTRHLRQHYVRVGHVNQFATVLYIEVMVRRHIGVEVSLGAVDADLAQQSSIGEVVECVVYGRERHVDFGDCRFLKEHFGRQVAIALAKQQPTQS